MQLEHLHEVDTTAMDVEAQMEAPLSSEMQAEAAKLAGGWSREFSVVICKLTSWFRRKLRQRMHLDALGLSLGALSATTTYILFWCNMYA